MTAIFNAAFPSYCLAHVSGRQLDPAKGELWKAAIDVVMPLVAEFGIGHDEHLQERVYAQLVSALPNFVEVLDGGGLSDDGLAPLVEAARRALFASPLKAKRGSWLFHKGSLVPGDLAPAAFVMPPQMKFTNKRIQRVIEGLLPVPQLREMLPHVWSIKGQQPVTVADHVLQLSKLADRDPTGFKMLMEGNLGAAECRCAGTPYVFTVRRQAIIWLLAEIARVARLIACVELIGSFAHSLGKAWTEDSGEGSETANAGRVLSAAESHARALNELAEIKPGQPRPKRLANEKLSVLDGALRPYVEGPIATILPFSEAVSASEWLHEANSSIEHAIHELGAMRSGAVNSADGTTTRPYLSYVRHIIGAAPATALAIIGLRVSQALTSLCKSFGNSTNNLTLALSPLSQMSWQPNVRLSGHVLVVMHICRVQLLAEDLSAESKANEQLTNWKTISLRERKTYMEAKNELSSRDPYKNALQDARKIIEVIADWSNSSNDQLAEAAYAEMFLDLSFRHRG